MRLQGRVWRRMTGAVCVAMCVGGSVAVAAAEAGNDAVDRMLSQVNRGRGLAGPALGTSSTRLVEDPRATEIAARLQALGLAGGGVPRPLPAAAPNAGPARMAARQRLAAVAGPSVELHLRPENQTIRQIRNGVLARAVRGQLANAAVQDPAEATARGFLRGYSDLLRIQDADAEFGLDRSEPDGVGGRHLRFRQRHGGLPVWPASVSVHLDGRGDVVQFDGAYIPTPAGVDVAPRVASEDAVLRARAAIPGGMRGEAGAPDLLVYAPIGGEPRLAWRIALNVGFTQAWLVVVDAEDGRILRRSNRVLDAGVNGSGRDLEGATRALNVWQAGATHYLVDTSKPMYKPGGDPVQQPQGAITIVDARLKKVNDLKGSDLFHITSANPNQWDIPDGVSAAYNFSQTYDYFLADHQRNSLDGQGGNITAIVRIGEYANASWNGNLKIMLFGNVEPYAGALDVVGHELTHGLTENSAGLVYENQSGALNESFSDIFGEMVEARVAGRPDWKMGTKLSKHIRDFVNPGSLTIGGLNRPYPAKMSEFVQLPNTDDADHGGVHINSSIINHTFWLLAEGLNGAVGRPDAARIFFRCLTQHLQAQSQFIDARLGCLAAAEALFGAGSTQVAKVAEAFDATGILAAPETAPPPPVQVVQGADSTLFLSADPFFGDLTLYRREDSQGDGALGSTFSSAIRLSRPAVTGDGSIALFVDAFNDLCLAETANPQSRECLGLSGLVHSVAVSPDGLRAAFVFRDSQTGQPGNRISVIEFGQSPPPPVTYELLAPTVDGAPVDAVLYADAMNFSTDGDVLVYDTLSRLRFGTGPAVERWSISALHLGTGKASIIVPPIEGVDTGNPSMGRAGNRYLVFDAQIEGTGDSAIIVMDLFTGQAARIDTVTGALGYPAFLGDESALVYAQRDTQAFITGYSLVRQPLAADRLGAQGQAVLWVDDAVLGVVYRRGAFTGSNELPTASITSPANGASLAPGAAAQIQAQVADADGSVVRVEFFDGDDKLGEDLAAPFALSWTPTQPGTHRLIIRAFDNLGASGDSPAVNVTVGGAPATGPRLAVQARAGGGLRLTVQGTAGTYTIQQSTDLRQWADLHPVTVGGDGQGSVDDAAGAAGGSARFFRARRN